MGDNALASFLESISDPKVNVKQKATKRKEDTIQSQAERDTSKSSGLSSVPKKRRWTTYGVIGGGAVAVVVLGLLFYPSGGSEKNTKTAESQARENGLEPSVTDNSAQHPEPPVEPQQASEQARRAATWVLKVGGKLHVTADGQRKEVQAPNSLPEAFTISGIQLSYRPIDDASLVNLAGLDSLQFLDLGWAPLTGSGLNHLAASKGLETLTLRRTQIGDSGLRNIRHMTALRSLDLGFTKVTDAGMTHLAGLRNLRELRLGSTKVTGAGLDNLKSLGNLTYLDVSYTQVTPAGVARLEASLTGCRIVLELAGSSSTEGSGGARTSDPDRRAAEWVLNVGGTLHVTAGHVLSVVQQMTDLPSRAYGVVYVDLRGIRSVQNEDLRTLTPLAQLESVCLAETQVTDAGLAILAESESLRRLDLENTQVSDASLDYLKRLSTLEFVDLSGTKVTPTGVLDFQASRPGCQVILDKQ
jgi:Leucine-rich repeat (LRR) protein